MNVSVYVGGGCVNVHGGKMCECECVCGGGGGCVSVHVCVVTHNVMIPQNN